MPGSWWSVLFLMSRLSISYSDADSWLFITISANHTRIYEPFTSQPHGIPPQHGRLSLRHASGQLQWNALIARWRPLNTSWPTCLHCGPCSLSHIMPLALILLLGLNLSITSFHIHLSCHPHLLPHRLNTHLSYRPHPLPPYFQIVIHPLIRRRSTTNKGKYNVCMFVILNKFWHSVLFSLDGEPCRRGCSTGAGRNLVVCIDGTANEFGLKVNFLIFIFYGYSESSGSFQNSHIVELYSHLVKNKRQLTYYNSGIGTSGSQSHGLMSSLMHTLENKVDMAIALCVSTFLVLFHSLYGIADHSKRLSSVHINGLLRITFRGIASFFLVRVCWI